MRGWSWLNAALSGSRYPEPIEFAGGQENLQKNSCLFPIHTDRTLHDILLLAKRNSNINSSRYLRNTNKFKNSLSGCFFCFYTFLIPQVELRISFALNQNFQNERTLSTWHCYFYSFILFLHSNLDPIQIPWRPATRIFICLKESLSAWIGEIAAWNYSMIGFGVKTRAKIAIFDKRVASQGFNVSIAVTAWLARR